MTKLKLTWRLTLLCLLYLTCSCTTLVKREAGSNTKKWFAALGSDLRNERRTAVREARQYAKDVSYGFVSNTEGNVLCKKWIEESGSRTNL